MRHLPHALILLLLAGCWDQFDAGFPPADDDDTSIPDDDDTSIDDDDTSVDDDDTSIDDDDTSVPDDDDTSIDDDDSSVDDDDVTVDDDDSSVDDDDTVDDDDSSVDDDDVTPIDPCDEPEDIQVTVTLTDPSGAASTEFTTTSPLTITVDVQNMGGGDPSYIYASECLFRWDLWHQNGFPVDGGPDCLIVQTERMYDCDGTPHTDSDEMYPVEFPSGVELLPGDYELVIQSYYFGDQTFTVTVP